MNRTTLISLTTVAMSVATGMATHANAQESPAKIKSTSVGPAIEFSGGGSSFGIQAKFRPAGLPVSIRPIVLFGYTPNVSNANFGQAIANGRATLLNNFTTLTADQKRAQVRLISDLPLNDKQADAVAQQVRAALSTPVANLTADQKFTIAKLQGAVNRYDIETFKNLTPAQQTTQAQIFSPPGTNVAPVVAALNQALQIPAGSRTPAQKQTVDEAKANLATSVLGVFPSLSAAQQSEEVKIFSRTPLTDMEVNDSVASLDAALKAPTTTRTAAQQNTIDTANQSISYIANTGTVGFTPGSGMAYGAALTYDFDSADRRLSAYVGPRVLYASGNNKIGNFSTNTTETSIGLLLGADYAVSNDLTAGVSAVYNFSRTGTLTVTGANGFRGTTPASGSSSLDFGVNVGYRF